MEAKTCTSDSAAVSGKIDFSCRHCDKKFNHPSNLYKHEMIHTGDRPFSCSLCDKKFIQKAHLQKHLISHHSGNGISEFLGVSYQKIKEQIKPEILVFLTMQIIMYKSQTKRKTIRFLAILVTLK